MKLILLAAPDDAVVASPAQKSAVLARRRGGQVIARAYRLAARPPRSLRRGIELPFKLFGLHEMAERGHRLESAGRETVGGVEYHVLRLRLDDGFETRYFLNTSPPDERFETP